MDKINKQTDRPENKDRKRITLQLIAGLFLIFISVTGVIIHKYSEQQQLKKFHGIARTRETDVIIPQITMDKEGEDTKESITFSYDWHSLIDINSDIKGWLYLPDTSINFPVVGAADNDYYLKHDFWKNENNIGSPFMDKDTLAWDFNRTIYAHNMGKSSTLMFSALLNFKDETYFQEHNTLYYTECFGTTAEYQVMAVIQYDARDIETWDFRTRNHEDAESRTIWMEKLKERALYYTEPDYTPDKILTLSTCDRSEYGKDGRLIVVASKC